MMEMQRNDINTIIRGFLPGESRGVGVVFVFERIVITDSNQLLSIGRRKNC